MNLFRGKGLDIVFAFKKWEEASSGQCTFLGLELCPLGVQAAAPLGERGPERMNLFG